MSTYLFQREIAAAFSNPSTPAGVLGAWLDAGAQTDLESVRQAAKQHTNKPELFGRVLDAMDPDSRPLLLQALPAEVMDNDAMLDATLARVTPAELNEVPGRSGNRPNWLTAFRRTPDFDDRDQDDPARIARLLRVLEKLRDAGADLESMRAAPVRGLEPERCAFGSLYKNHRDAVHIALRVAHERRELRQAVDEAQATPVPSLSGLGARLDARASSANPTGDEPAPSAASRFPRRRF